MLSIRVPATSANMGPGFDTLGVAISLYNTVRVQRSKIFSVSIKGEGHNNPKLKGNNLFVNIFYEHYMKLTGSRDNFKFAFSNQIPLSRGLGSSSAVIISAILAAYEAAEVKVSKEDLLNLALVHESHPDNITPAVMGGFNVAILEDNKVKSIKKNMPKDICSIVVVPKQPISTAQARKVLPNRYSKDDAIFNLSHSSLLTAAFMSEDWDMLRSASKDRFHQYYRMKQMPELFAVQKVALENGALMSTLSGSGSTFFNMGFKEDVEKIKGVLRKEFPNYFIRSYQFDNQGSRVTY